VGCSGLFLGPDGDGLISLRRLSGVTPKSARREEIVYDTDGYLEFGIRFS